MQIPKPALTLLYALLLAAAPGLLAAQSDSITVTAGPQYAADGLKALLLGRGYRDLWTTPIRVPVLDLATFAGGLTPTQRGGGMQTISLRLRGEDGREYVFRSVDKDQSGGLPEDFRNTLIDRLAQDQVSKKNPASSVIAAPLTQAAGVLVAAPRLVLMPAHPFLGEFRAEFAGMLGTIEERPEESEEGALEGRRDGLAGAEKVSGTENLFEDLEESPEERVDSRSFLTARLVDFLIGDWDRHPDQWRWARFDRAGGHLWVPIARDRDNAFSRYDGPLVTAARGFAPNLVEFGPEYPGIYALTYNAQPLDRTLLAELPRPVFDSTALALQARLTDAVLDSAVARMPAEYRALRGAQLARALRDRRDRLPGIAREFYELLASEVDVHATDEPELAVADRYEDGSMEVRLFRVKDESGPPAGWSPYYQRRFLPGETNEVRIYLHGGDDRAVVRGSGPGGLVVRVIGGGGDDLLADSSAAGAAFYDDRGRNRFVRGAATRVDTRPYGQEEGDSTAQATAGETIANNAPAGRDWGTARSVFPTAGWRSNIGPALGAGVTFTQYGFRREPYARRLLVRALYAPFPGRAGAELEGEVRRIGSRSRMTLFASATQLAVTRFHGFGNSTGHGEPNDRYKVFASQFSLEPALVLGLDGATDLSLGPVLRYTRPEVEAGGPADRLRPFGAGGFAQLGARLGLSLDTRDSPAYPRSGVRVRASASAYPGLWQAERAFGRLEGSVATYLPLALPLESTLAVRAGGRRAWGGFPIQEAAFLGGGNSLRGYPTQRFAGDASLFGGAELRTFLTRFNFVARGDLGVLGLAEAGRVFAPHDSSDGWHTGFGGGLWAGTLQRSWTGSVVYAYGERSSVYITLGMPF